MTSKTKKAFLMYYDYYDIISELNDEQAGKLLKTIYGYLMCDSELESEDGMLRIVWKQIRNNLVRDAAKYEQVIEEQTRKGKLGGIIRALKDGNNVSKESVKFLAESNIGRRYLESQGIPVDTVEEIWQQIESYRVKL